MNYKELKEFLETLSEEQLNQQAVIFKDDNENPEGIVTSKEISQEDFYWDHCDCLGNLEEAKEILGKNWQNDIDEYTKVPAGTVTLHIN